ncbi:BRCA1-associated protein-like [Pomacea canaliculata]|uniref:BRCA1-associated protein-like n=1 Tax=Pomacea canaliculata TaxID=400727 RepID=UPI000D73A686|nr:BRCA1-associated protein-like [Pomacea canaliculata]
MLISLVVIRLEIADDCIPPANFQTYCAPNFEKETSRETKSSYVSVTRHPSTSKEGTPPKPHLTKENLSKCRGLRELLDISIEVLNFKDIKKMENEEKEQGLLKRVPEESKISEDGFQQSKAKSELSTKELAASSDAHTFRPIRKSESDGHDTEGPGPAPAPENAWTRPRSHSPTGKSLSTVHFVSGNPCVELVKGVLHIYKDRCIPAAYTIHDLIKFTAPLNDSMEHMQVLRGAVRNQYMLLIRFKDQKSADEFYSYFNNRPFNSIEPDVCHLVYVAKVEITKESEGGSLPIPGLTELPHCPVCLERMEESVDGILTILCNHSFHMSCLAQWGDTSCPVCRYCQTPEEVPDQRCMQCGSQESLWICLICGSVGCGRYVGLHAYKHFQETNHTYAMQLGSNRVWDYAGDNYVHRLVQNKSDGKLVQVDEGGNVFHEEKLNSITLEYTYLLTTQLESQRQYFEEKILEATKDANLRVTELQAQLESVCDDKEQMALKLKEAMKEKQSLDKKCSNLHNRLTKVLTELQEERDMNKCLLENQQLWQKRVTNLESHVKDLSASKEKEIADLREQLRDVMFFLEAQEKLANTTDVSQEEIQEGQVIVGATASPSAVGRKGHKKRR